MKNATKKAAKKSKTTVGEGARGRKPALAGKRFYRTKKECNLRSTGKVRDSFDLIKDGTSFEKFIEKGGALKDINYFIKLGLFKAQGDAKPKAAKKKATAAAETATA